MKQDDILEVKKRHETSLLALQGVVGVGIGETDHKGRRTPYIRVYVQQLDEAVKKRVPDNLDGFPVAVVEVGRTVLH